MDVIRTPSDAPARSAPMAPAPASLPPLVTIGGPSRSGSTLVTLLLGATDDAVAVGELRYLWSRGLHRNMLCGCGVPLRSCGFWRSVLARVYGSLERVPYRELDSLQRSVGEIWHLPLLLARARRPDRFDERVDRFTQHLGALLDAIRSESGASVIVDSSKLPSHCLLLAEAAGPGTRLIHLVRDSRAVSFSQSRKKRKPDIHWRDAYMRRFTPVQSALDWNGLNLAMEVIAVAGRPVTLARYEDLVREPAAWLERLVPEVGTPPSLSDRTIVLDLSHTVSGNPLRFGSGEVTIRPDTEWRARMSTRDRAIVTATTLPLLARYRYV